MTLARRPDRAARMTRPANSTRPSNRLKHGLTSRSVAEARASEVRALARALLPDGPFEAEVQKQAEALADSIISLDAIRRARFDLLSRKHRETYVECSYWIRLLADLCYDRPVGIAHFDAAEEWDDQSEWGALRAVLRTMWRNRQDLHRLDEYERKAFSRYCKCLMRFDYAVIDSRRRVSSIENSGRQPDGRRLPEHHHKQRRP